MMSKLCVVLCTLLVSAAFIWGIESRNLALTWSLAGVVCVAFLISTFVMSIGESVSALSAGLLSGFLVLFGTGYWAWSQVLQRGGDWRCFAVVAGALAIMISMIAARGPATWAQWAGFWAVSGLSLWALLDHQWGLLWSIVGGAFLISAIVDISCRRREPPGLFRALWACTLLGSLAGLIVWGTRYHVWWPLAAWGAALFVAIGSVVRGIQESQEEDDRAELTRRQLRALRDKQTGHTSSTATRQDGETQ